MLIQRIINVCVDWLRERGVYTYALCRPDYAAASDFIASCVITARRSTSSQLIKNLGVCPHF